MILPFGLTNHAPVPPGFHSSQPLAQLPFLQHAPIMRAKHPPTLRESGQEHMIFSDPRLASAPPIGMVRVSGDLHPVSSKISGWLVGQCSRGMPSLRNCAAKHTACIFLSSSLRQDWMADRQRVRCDSIFPTSVSCINGCLLHADCSR